MLSNDELYLALVAYYDKDSKLFRKGFQKSYIENNWTEKEIVKTTALVLKSLKRNNLAKLYGASDAIVQPKMQRRPKWLQQKLYTDSVPIQGKNSVQWSEQKLEYVPDSGKDISELEKHMRDKKRVVSRYNPYTLEKEEINPMPGYLHYPKPRR